ncbi:tyrosine-type recombinase/integrase [Nocardia sp. CDC186]|uniref:Tyrosine-type recombinase/integrase n=1 Tax=Nocardia implantans TaxID=3108168 RepID=A0ABU6B2D5_9NOCA|nr:MULTISPECIES: site-specific integrase [unclassified Nocardia]MBF6195673.1 site-specific integrase [Nocardia beijingensis]MEA3531241.1 tyrosine-type recombinase/integrase [Nocardia sp. CDC192]MEB3513549.1 tyrosine-type recombinase/integrase [Nocardia sp. CDC186]
MATRRNPRAGIEDRWYPTVVEVDPETGKVTKKKVKSDERFGKGKRWRARYVDPNGVERSRSFDTKAAAQKFLDSDVTTKVVTGTWVDPDRSGVLFEVVAEKWFATKKFRKPKTVAGYRSLLDTIVLPRWGEVRLREIEFEDIQEWVVALSESGSSRFEGRGLSASRVIQSYQVLSQVLRFAIKAKRLAANPAEDIDLPSMMAGERRYLTHVEVMRLAMAAGRFRPLVLTLAYTGIRFGEAIALRTSNVDLEQRRIRITRSATGVTGKGIVETDTKNHTTRAVPVPGTLAKDLANLLSGRRPDALVFPSHKCGYLTSTEFRWVFDQAAKEAGLVGVVPHGLRHTAASLAISAGANIKVVQRMLGHKTATLTLDLYGHLFPDDLDVVADGMDAGARAAADYLRTA